MFLIDTNVVSELRRSDRADANVLAWARTIRDEEVWISVVSVLELERGVLLMERRDATQGAVLRGWLENEVLSRFEGYVLPIDVAIARRCAGLHMPNPRPDRDALIAATALERRLTIVTRNEADFRPMGATVFNPWFGQ